MKTKLKSVIVDNDESAVKIMEGLCHNSPLIEVKHSFLNPEEFLEKAPHLDFDICIMDVMMKQMEGLTVAQLLNGKPYIFVTDAISKLRDALNLNPIDIVMKPVLKDRLHKALDKAYGLLLHRKEFGLFSVAESAKKVSLRIPDMLLVRTDDDDSRHKMVTMRSGEKFTLMDCTLDYLLNISERLVQANKRELVSLDAVNELQHDLITLKGLPENKPAYISLSRTYCRSFREKMFYIK